MKIASRVGPTFVKTRRTPPAEIITTQVGPKFVKVTGRTGANLGDHTQSFNSFNSMRRVRNQLEYPRNPSDLDIDAAETEQAIANAQRTIEAVEQLLPELGIWQS